MGADSGLAHAASSKVGAGDYCLLFAVVLLVPRTLPGAVGCWVLVGSEVLGFSAARTGPIKPIEHTGNDDTTNDQRRDQRPGTVLPICCQC